MKSMKFCMHTNIQSLWKSFKYCTVSSQFHFFGFNPTTRHGVRSTDCVAKICVPVKLYCSSFRWHCRWALLLACSHFVDTCQIPSISLVYICLDRHSGSGTLHSFKPGLAGAGIQQFAHVGTKFAVSLQSRNLSSM